jgi:hypothetical protein
MIVVADIYATSEQATRSNFNPVDTRNVQAIGRTKTSIYANAWRERLATKGVNSLNPCISIDISSFSNVD